MAESKLSNEDVYHCQAMAWREVAFAFRALARARELKELPVSIHARQRAVTNAWADCERALALGPAESFDRAAWEADKKAWETNEQRKFTAEQERLRSFFHRKES